MSIYAIELLIIAKIKYFYTPAYFRGNLEKRHVGDQNKTKPNLGFIREGVTDVTASERFWMKSEA